MFIKSFLHLTYITFEILILIKISIIVASVLINVSILMLIKIEQLKEQWGGLFGLGPELYILWLFKIKK